MSILPGETADVFKIFNNVVQEINILRSLRAQGANPDLNDLLKLYCGQQATDREIESMDC